MDVIFLDPIPVILEQPNLNICKSLTKKNPFIYKYEVQLGQWLWKWVLYISFAFPCLCKWFMYHSLFGYDKILSAFSKKGLIVKGKQPTVIEIM